MDARPTRGRGRILVVYDFGSALPRRMAAAAQDSGWELVFALADSDHARSMKRTLGLLGAVVDAAGRPFGDVVAELFGFGLTGIVTFSEYQIRFTASLAAALGLRYQAPEDVLALTDKTLQRQRLRDTGVEDVRHSLIHSVSDVDLAVDAVGLPAIVKPVVGVSSRNTYVVASRDEVRNVVAVLLTAPAEAEGREPALLLEEFFAGRPTAVPWADYIAVETLAYDGWVTPLFVLSKFALAPPFRERGGYGPHSIEDRTVIEAVCDKACRAVAALGMRWGIAEAEIKLTDQGPRVIEVNGRLGGWADDIANRTGTGDPVRVALACAAGEEPVLTATGDRGAIAFQYLLHAPMEATRVASIHGVRRLRGIPRADRVFVRVREGSPVDWRKGSASSIGAVWGRAADHTELAETIAEIEATDWITYGAK